MRPALLRPYLSSGFCKPIEHCYPYRAQPCPQGRGNGELRTPWNAAIGRRRHAASGNATQAPRRRSKSWAWSGLKQCSLPGEWLIFRIFSCQRAPRLSTNRNQGLLTRGCWRVPVGRLTEWLRLGDHKSDRETAGIWQTCRIGWMSFIVFIPRTYLPTSYLFLRCSTTQNGAD